MVLRIFKTYICILFFLYEFKCKDSNELKEIILNKYEYELDVSEFGLTLLNLNTELYDMNYSLMAYINDTFFNEDLFNYFTPFFNHFWIFYISDIKVLNDILNKYKGKNDYMTIYGIIIPKKLMNIIPRNFNKQTPSIFYIEDNIADVLIESDFRTNDKMVYFSFDTEKPISRYPEDYYFALTVIIFIISSIILMLWVVFYRVSKKKDMVKNQHKFGSATQYFDAGEQSEFNVENNFGKTEVFFSNIENYLGDGTLRVENNMGTTVINVPKEWNPLVDIENNLGFVKTGDHHPENGKVLNIVGENNMGSVVIEIV